VRRHTYEAYSVSKYRFAVKKSSKVSYKIPLFKMSHSVMCVIFPHENNAMLFSQAVSCDAVPVSTRINTFNFKYYSHLSFIKNNK